ncbi:MAG TPA: ferritin-like domain-containing protein [Acidobacteriota bacterium]|nr:ferritin-like domain-containing protein [Acidobacteriota bacterium]
MTKTPERTQTATQANLRPLIDGLNEALNREVTTFLRYMLQASVLKGVEWAPLRSLYEEEVSDERGHAQYLANKIVMLGSKPRLDVDVAEVKTDPRAMIEFDIEQEQEDVKGYKRLAKLAEELGFIELQLKMEDLAADESRHAEELQRLLG